MKTYTYIEFKEATQNFIDALDGKDIPDGLTSFQKGQLIQLNRTAAEKQMNRIKKIQFDATIKDVGSSRMGALYVIKVIEKESGDIVDFTNAYKNSLQKARSIKLLESLRIGQSVRCHFIVYNPLYWNHNYPEPYLYIITNHEDHTSTSCGYNYFLTDISFI